MFQRPKLFATMYQSVLLLTMYSLLFICEASLLAASHQRTLSQETSLLKDLKIPGHNPAYHCEDPADDLFTIHYMNDNPDPPRR